jgi:hypothetical protein
MRRAQVTTENAHRMYGDLLDRVLADREEAATPQLGTHPQPSTQPSSTRQALANTQPDTRSAAAGSPKTRPIHDGEEVHPRVKATFYLYPEDIVTIDRIQMQAFLSTGKKPQRSEIVSRALRLLGSQELSGDT